MTNTKIRTSAPQASRMLRNLWDDRMEIHKELLNLASDIERYGEVGNPEIVKLKEVYEESREMTEALKRLLDGVQYGT